MDVPIHSDPEVLERLYQRFPYLAGHPLKLRGPVADAVNLGALEVGDRLLYLLADPEERVPYRAKFPFLNEEENRGLTDYAQVQPVEPWPQPTINVLWNASQGEGVVSSIENVEVFLRPAGNAQLWWGGKAGVIWEAFFEGDMRAKAEHDELMHGLWERCEGYLREKGVRVVHTYANDPALDECWYAAFLEGRGYHQDSARAHLPAGLIAVVKDLDEPSEGSR